MCTIVHKNFLSVHIKKFFMCTCAHFFFPDFTHCVKENMTASAFPIHIDGNSLISDLKEVIKEKNVQNFANIDAKDLKL